MSGMMAHPIEEEVNQKEAVVLMADDEKSGFTRVCGASKGHILGLVGE